MLLQRSFWIYKLSYLIRRTCHSLYVIRQSKRKDNPVNMFQIPNGGSRALELCAEVQRIRDERELRQFFRYR